MRVRTGIVTTLRHAGPSLESFVRYHCTLGFDHLYLFFDDPRDPDIDRVATHARVTIVRGDERLHAAWQRTPVFRIMRRFAAREVCARQALNAAVALERARADGLDWLLHIDADELFYCDDGRDVPAVFGALADAGATSAIFWNHEVLVDRMTVSDGFKELRLFKKNPRGFAGDDGRGGGTARAVIASVPRLRSEYFLGYANGKSAARVGAGVIPTGAHRFASLPGRAGENGTAAAPGRPAPDDPHLAILHYLNAGLDAFVAKYRAFGAFPDTWFGRVQIRSVFPRHLEARDVVATGDRDLVRRFFEQHILMDDPALVDTLRTSGIVLAIDGPARLLSED